MKILLLLIVSSVFFVSCSGKGFYLYYGKDASSELDRPWVIIGKKDVGSSIIEKRLCGEKELKQILEEAHLDEKETKDLFEAACGEGASAVKFLHKYYAFEPAKKIRLRESFERHGYFLNDYGC